MKSENEILNHIIEISIESCSVRECRGELSSALSKQTRDGLLALKKEVIKPCPFCGGKASVLPDDSGIIYIECNECSAKTGLFTDGSKVIKAWNRRCG